MRTVKKALFLTLALSLVLGGTFILTPEKEADAKDFCTSDACKQAEADYLEATKKADEARSHANTLEGEIERLNAEITAMENKIEANKLIVEDLKVQIAEQKAILEQQQAGFAEIGADVHFKEKESELIQALKYTISERAEKKARDENVKAQISSSVNTINENMKALELKQAQVEALIEDQQIQSDRIAENKNRQAELKTKYENDASQYSEDAKAAERKRGEEIAKEIAKYNSTGKVVASGLNSYPKAGDCPQNNYTNIGYVIYYDGMAICQCTSYANWKVRESWGKSAVGFGIMGNAKDWGRSAAAAGLRVDDEPEPHTVGYQTSGIFGHVVWIEGVNADGTVNLSEYNNLYSSVSGQKGDFGYRVNVPASSFRYIHFR